MPLWRLQRVREEVLDFLYEQREHGREITLRPGVAYCLRRFHPLVTELVRSAWLQYVARQNGPTLGSSADLSEFLFGSERGNLSVIRPMLEQFQGGDCFYCGSRIRGAGHIDHFVPWARYPVDLGHNFVLADDRCNMSKGMMLAAEPHLERWHLRNEQYCVFR
jgi:5-methylcytosine-specific restriction endonuclease McrA